MKCNSCVTALNDGKCPQDCLEKLFCTTLDNKGYMERRKDDVWCEDVYDVAMEVGMTIEDQDLLDSQGVIERIAKDHSDGWLPFLQAPFIYDVTRRYGELLRQLQDKE